MSKCNTCIHIYKYYDEMPCARCYEHSEWKSPFDIKIAELETENADLRKKTASANKAVGMIEFNVNDYIYVRLTDVGRNELRKDHDKFNSEYCNVLGKYVPPKEDENGWSKWQAHDIMHRLGKIMGPGFDPPFETTIRIKDYQQSKEAGK